MVMSALTTFLGLLSALNFWGWHQNYLGFGLGIIWLFLTSWLLGGRTGQLSNSRTERLIWGLVITLGCISIIGSVLFYLNLYNPVAVVAISSLLPWFGTSKKTQYISTETNTLSSVQLIISWFTAALYLVIISVIFLLLNSVINTEAIRTPWSIVPPTIFILLALAASLVLALTRNKSNPIWLVPFYFIFLTLLVNIFPLGYGFDPFIHQASEKLLAATGTISPKPFYYLGQYTLVTFLAQILALPIRTIDTWLLPLISGLVLPISAYSYISKLKINNNWYLLLALTPLLFALSYFTYTTPQGLAYLWVIITIFIIASQKLGTRIPVKIPWILSLAAFFTHPLAGLPLIGVVTLWWLQEYGNRFKYIRYWKITTRFAIALIIPLTFVLLSWLKPSAASIKFTNDIFGNLTKLWSNISFQLPFIPRFIDLPDIIYTLGRPLILSFVVLSVIGFVLARREYKNLKFFGEIALLPTISYLILTLLFVFPNLPPNEQNFYSLRLWEIAQLVLWPLAILGLYILIKKITEHLEHTTTWIIAGSLLLTASFYFTYPRFDIWHRDTAYNTTTYDLAAVKLIDYEAANSNYVVLANQAVSAAAVNEFGFSKYYDGFFYYPLPTGVNPLYQVYLNAVERGLPTRQIISEASNIGVSQVFLVLNSYWADYDKLKQIAQVEADASWDIANGKISIYRYDF